MAPQYGMIWYDTPWAAETEPTVHTYNFYKVYPIVLFFGVYTPFPRREP